MGVDKFGGWVKNRYGSGKRNRVYNTFLPDNIGALCLDLNGVLHQAAQQVYGYHDGDPKSIKDRKKREEQEARLKANAKLSAKELETAHMMRVVEIIFYDILLKVKPEDYLILAIDGVAPMAKITQQRKRRYKAAKDSAETYEDDPSLKPEVKMPKFDSSCISPGTEFMMNLDYFIQKALSDNIKAGSFSVKNIVYSSHLVPGEGEHKIFDMLRAGKDTIDIPKDKNIIVYGKDADLFMLTLLSTTPNLYLVREDLGESYNIDELRKGIYNDMLVTVSTEEKKIPMNIVIQDFVTLLFMFGNDFLPRVPSLDNFELAVGRMYITYAMLEEPLSDENGQILWRNFSIFLRDFGKYETKLLEKVASETYDYPFVTLDKATEKIKNPETNSYTVKVDLNKFRQNWYEKCLLPKNKEVLGFIQLTPSKIESLCAEFCKGMQWCLRYYMNGHKSVSSKFIFIYFYAPLIYDLQLYLQNVSAISLPTMSDVGYSLTDPVITPIHQLICIMPPVSWSLIPEPYRSLMPVRFADLSPVSFEVDKEGLVKKGGQRNLRAEHNAIAILSIVDPFRIVADIEDYPVPNKYLSTINRFIRVPQRIKYIRGKNLKSEYEEFMRKNEETSKIIEEYEKNNVPAKVEPKSPAQIKRLVKTRVEHVVKERENMKALKTENVAAWVNYDLL